MRKTVIVFAMVLILMNCLYSCAKIEPQNTGNSSLLTPSPPAEATGISAEIPPVSAATAGETSAPLEQWIGVYRFGEYKHGQSMWYDFSIYKEDGTYYARCYVFGHQTLNEFLVSVKGDIESVDFIFDEYTGYNLSEPYKKGDLLLTFTNDHGILLTDWGAIQPILKENETGGIIFGKGANGSWPSIGNEKILQDTVLVQELDKDEGLFCLGMAIDDVIAVLDDKGVCYDSYESSEGVGDYFVYYNLFDDRVEIGIRNYVVNYIEIIGSIPLRITATQSGLNLGDSFDKMVELYGDDYTVDMEPVPGEEMYKFYSYKIGDYQFYVYFLNDAVERWGISKFKYDKT